MICKLAGWNMARNFDAVTYIFHPMHHISVPPLEAQIGDWFGKARGVCGSEIFLWLPGGQGPYRHAARADVARAAFAANSGEQGVTEDTDEVTCENCLRVLAADTVDLIQAWAAAENKKEVL